jgi:hypothetical protein
MIWFAHGVVAFAVAVPVGLFLFALCRAASWTDDGDTALDHRAVSEAQPETARRA